jgi:hypothetical protein
MNIESYMEHSITKLRTLAKDNRFSVKNIDNVWQVTYTYKEPDDFFGATREFNLPHFINGSDERMAILYTLRRYF